MIVLCYVIPAFSFLTCFVLNQKSDCSQEHPLGKKHIKTAKWSLTDKKFRCGNDIFSIYISAFFPLENGLLGCEISYQSKSLTGRSAICVVSHM